MGTIGSPFRTHRLKNEIPVGENPDQFGFIFVTQTAVYYFLTILD
jgi:hypothetical protein